MSTIERQDEENRDLVQMVADIVSAYVSFNTVASTEVPTLIRTVHSSFSQLGNAEAAAPAAEQKPAVPVRKSVQDDYIVCLEDGKKLKMLKRYLRTRYDMTPDEYRRKWGLPPDYPMVAPSYSKQRSKFAKDIGLGRR
ncbi:MAG TPA: MucR family transcriptional regulator [Alphaproteobacteria bacterium]|jgi:predicted transcriptional regulator|nr:MucR family transcriptional regulator [Alphaproteobacteria bacterium]